MNPADKRLAVKVEDHPLEYGDFEGLIPEGNYGAGAVVLWDRGVWVPLEDVEEGFAKGKLLFDLRGYKLRGRWTLVKIKKTEKEWLLIKERDHLATDEDGTVFPEGSVISGLTVEDLREGIDPGGKVRTELEASGVPRAVVEPKSVDLMLAESREEPFSKNQA
jgi:bifunctional non-homologous end joining protein LigD